MPSILDIPYIGFWLHFILLCDSTHLCFSKTLHSTLAPCAFVVAAVSLYLIRSRYWNSFHVCNFRSCCANMQKLHEEGSIPLDFSMSFLCTLLIPKLIKSTKPCTVGRRGTHLQHQILTEGTSVSLDGYLHRTKLIDKLELQRLAMLIFV